MPSCKFKKRAKKKVRVKLILNYLYLNIYIFFQFDRVHVDEKKIVKSRLNVLKTKRNPYRMCMY